jgi:hypothetical protein
MRRYKADADSARSVSVDKANARALEGLLDLQLSRNVTHYRAFRFLDPQYCCGRDPCVTRKIFLPPV